MEMELSNSNIKKNYYIFSKKSISYIFLKEVFSYFSGLGTLGTFYPKLKK